MLATIQTRIDNLMKALQQVVLPLQCPPTVYARPAAGLPAAASQVVAAVVLAAAAVASVHRAVLSAVLAA